MHEYDVPHDESAHECPYCGRPFAEGRLLDLHRGLEHRDRIDDDERAAYREAYESESGDLNRFRIVAGGLLALLYFGLLIAYALV